MNKNWLWTGKPWQAFKTFAIFFSFFMNLVLLVVLFVAAPLIIPIVADVAVPLVGGLNRSFVDMNAASIERTIQVDDNLDIAFNLPLETTTNVVVVQDVALDGVPAQFVFPGGGGAINGRVYLSLPEGLSLPVQLDLDVPVNQTIPVELAVAVDIPLSETELGAPFNRLQSLFGPLDSLLRGLPTSNVELFERITQRTTNADETTESAGVP
jgi:hypothetical protein